MSADMDAVTWFETLPLAVRIVLAVVALAIIAGAVLGVLQALGVLPASWSPHRFRAWFERRRDGS